MKAVETTTGGIAERLQSVSTVEQVSWGRNSKAKWQHNAVALLVIVAPVSLCVYWLTLEHFDASFSRTIQVHNSAGLIPIASTYLPRPSFNAFVGYTGWMTLQAVLYAVLPGQECFGQRTPGGHQLRYTANGLMAWMITHVLFLSAAVLGVLDPAIIAKNWSGLFVAANVCGFLVAGLALLKARLAPSHPEDLKWSGSLFFDFWAGAELNPRLGQDWDLKFFFNGRPGIVAWTLIDISWAAYQHQIHGSVTTSMLILLLLHAIYVVDFFINEDWYTRTIDIAHDHFGFMLAWGDTTFLPVFYTLQAQYLARHPTYLSTTQSLLLVAFGLSGYAIFRLANHEKDYVRSQDGEAVLWGRPATFIRCNYRTSDGKEHSSLLLTSGWWGFSRHSNYTGDLIMSFAMCATCGFTHVLPWSYFFYMITLLYHRVGRDEARCRTKYGRKWEEYCEKVPYRLVPGIY